MTDTSPELTGGEKMTSMKEPVKVSPSKSSEKFVKYVGTATRRLITAEHWAGVGAPDMPTTEWTVQNEFKIPVSEFTESALRYVERDDRLKVTD